MKSAIKFLVVILAMNVAFALTANKANAQEPVVNNQVFYDELSPYGEWIQNPNYGYVWVPNAGPYFSPYQTAGHWSYTNYGWTWVSDYPWGWAPFHYGRWDRDPSFGWFWTPGQEWGPAWVTWRQCDGYYGWAPIAPGISIEYAYGRDYYPPQERWVFVNQRYINDPYVYNYYAPRGNNLAYINRTTVIYERHDDHDRGYYYNQGPRVEEVERYTGNKVVRYDVVNNDHPGQRSSTNGNSIAMYRPVVNKTVEGRGAQPAPRTITERNAIKPENERGHASENIINRNNTQTNNTQRGSNTGGNQVQTSHPNQQQAGHPAGGNVAPNNVQHNQPNNVQHNPGKPVQGTPNKVAPNNTKPAVPANNERGKAGEPAKEEEHRNPR